MVYWFDFQISVPNKVADYCAGSMRTLSNLGGEVPRLVSRSVNSYPTGDVEALVRVLTESAANPDCFRRKHPPARAVFEEHCNAAKVLPDFVAFLEGIARA